MKFVLKPNYRNFTDQELIDNIFKVSIELRKKNLKLSDYTKSMRNIVSGVTIVKRFGNWNNAIQKANTEILNRYGTWDNAMEKISQDVESPIVPRTKNISDDELIEDLKKVAIKIGSAKVTQSLYDKFGNYSSALIFQRFGWNQALESAGLEISNYKNVPKIELFKNLENLWIKLGRQPSRDDLKRPNSKYSRRPYIKEFGNWTNTLKTFVEWSNSSFEINETDALDKSMKSEQVDTSPIQDKSFNHVYLMVDIKNNFYKIGLSNNPEYRERTLQSEKPTIKLLISKEFPTRQIAFGIERDLQKKYSDNRIRGEWFNLNENDIIWIKEFLSQK